MSDTDALLVAYVDGELDSAGRLRGRVRGRRWLGRLADVGAGHPGR